MNMGTRHSTEWVNAVEEGLSSYINFFVDDAKLLRVIRSNEDCMDLQGDIGKIREWSQKTVDIWNSLSEEIVAAESVHKFNCIKADMETGH
ncbi:hypothetical protein E2C01_049071 [Portunus trituberculatus]|uniref:Uncharacterized protein n=1 Tax=Portunus trituberculatus TaxID=210409 RepID=A0A5B7G4P1_PORTR|nr:hypothetical protein [Portunus trituberculatus]